MFNFKSQSPYSNYDLNLRKDFVDKIKDFKSVSSTKKKRSRLHKISNSKIITKKNDVHEHLPKQERIKIRKLQAKEFVNKDR